MNILHGFTRRIRSRFTSFTEEVRLRPTGGGGGGGVGVFGVSSVVSEIQKMISTINVFKNVNGHI